MAGIYRCPYFIIAAKRGVQYEDGLLSTDAISIQNIGVLVSLVCQYKLDLKPTAPSTFAALLDLPRLSKLF